MKKYALIAALAMIVAVCSVSSVQAVNLLDNGGFEFPINIGWDVLDWRGSSLTIENNFTTGTAIEGANYLRVKITNATGDPNTAWHTRILAPITEILYAGHTFDVSFTVKKLSQDGAIYLGLMENFTGNSFFWPGKIDLSKQPINVPVTYRYKYAPDYDKWYPTVVFNLAETNMDVIIDNVKLEDEAEIVTPATFTISGVVRNNTKHAFSNLFVLLYPEGDVVNGEKGAIPVWVGNLAIGKAVSWSKVVPSGKYYTAQLQSEIGYIYGKITTPFIWNFTSDADISGVDFNIRCNQYTNMKTFTGLNDACVQ